MKKRIYLNFLALILIITSLLLVSVSGIVYNAIRNREIAAIKDRAVLAADLLKRIGSDENLSDYMNLAAAARITIIAADGTVLLDNKAAAQTLDNHGDRDEFRQALAHGHGEATRYSGTLGADTYYYALRLDDGSILRVSNTISNISSVFFAVLPAIAGAAAIVLLLANLIARRLTGSILRPLENIDFDSGNQNVYDELVPYVKKIEQQKTEIAAHIAMLKNRADTIEAITDNMKEGLLIIDKSGLVLSNNKSALDIFNEADLRQKNILHMCRDMAFRKAVGGFLSGENKEIVFERSGKIYNVFLSPVRNGGEITGGVILFLDISEKFEVEQQRREFTANVSHELKTPLTTISALAEMMENGMVKDGDTRAFAQKITAQTKRLINVIEDIIRLSEFDEGEIAAEHSEFDLYELAQSVIEVLRGRADEKRVSVSVSGERFNIRANRQMIDELLYNLIDNAIKYNVDSGSVTVALSKENGFCKIAVADTGIGIPKEHQGRVFERFYRVDKSRSKKTGGTGLGLSIVKHIAKHHGGRVEIESAEGRGTTVACYIGSLEFKPR